MKSVKFNSYNPPKIIPRYGGKGRFASLYMPYIERITKEGHCNIFIDAFSGGGSFTTAGLLLLDENYNYVYDRVIANDLDIGISTTFKVIKDADKCNELTLRILDTPYDKESFDNSHNIIEIINEFDYIKQIEDFGIDGSMEDVAALLKRVDTKNKLLESLSDVDIAYHNIINTLLSYNCSGNNFRDWLNINSNIDYSKKLYNYAVRLPELSPFLDRMDVYNMDGCNFIKLMQCKYGERMSNCCLVLDPPYVRSTRAESAQNVYIHEMGNVQHHELLLMLDKIEHWILCGYDDSKVYRMADSICKEKIDLGAQHQPSSNRHITEDQAHEVIWLK